MKLRKNSGKILWGLFFILAAVYVVVSKLWIMPEVSVFSILLTVFFIWLFLNGIRNVNFWEILFSIAFNVSYTMTGSESQPSHRGQF